MGMHFCVNLRVLIILFFLITLHDVKLKNLEKKEKTLHAVKLKNLEKRSNASRPMHHRRERHGRAQAPLHLIDAWLGLENKNLVSKLLSSNNNIEDRFITGPFYRNMCSLLEFFNVAKIMRHDVAILFEEDDEWEWIHQVWKDLACTPETFHDEEFGAF